MTFKVKIGTNSLACRENEIYITIYGKPASSSGAIGGKTGSAELDGKETIHRSHTPRAPRPTKE